MEHLSEPIPLYPPKHPEVVRIHPGLRPAGPDLSIWSFRPTYMRQAGRYIGASHAAVPSGWRHPFTPRKENP